jgi:PAS domain S-box-containing protein
MKKAPATSSPVSVLVVDDDPDICTALKDLLENEGYLVQVAATGKDAIALVQQDRYSATLLDIGLPDIDGLSVLENFLAVDPKLPVIILTAYTTEHKTIGALSKGAFAYLTKPYNREELKATLRRAIGVKTLALKAERVELALGEYEERFRSLVESATDAIILADQGGMIVSWNKGAQAIFGYMKDEIVGQPLTALMPARYHEAHRQGLERMRRGGKAHVIGRTVELHGVRKDGAEFPLELSLATWKTREGQWYSGIIRDITERKRTERRLAVEHTTTRILAESATLQEAARKILPVICEDLGWEIGEIWHVDSEAGVLRCLETWSAHPADFAEFASVTRSLTFESGRGLPGRVWTAGKPVWVSDVLRDLNFPRAQVAAKCGFHAGVGFPILIGGEALGVLEFFSREIRQPDQLVLTMMASIGSQMGQFAERKSAEAALERLRHTHALVLHSAGEGIYGVDTHGRTTFVNPAGARMLGWQPAELLGRPIHPLVHHTRPDGTPYPGEDCAIYAAFKDGHVHVVDTEVFWRKDGSSFPVEYVSTPIREQEELVGAVVVFKDITERKRAEEALLESEERLRVALTAGEMGTWDWHIQSGRVVWSDNVEPIFGLPRGTFAGTYTAFLDRLHPDDRESTVHAIRDAIEGRKDYEVEHRIIRPDGAIRWLACKGRVVRDQAGKPFRMLGTVQDTTDKKRAIEALRESQERFQQLAENIREVFWMTNPEKTEMIYISPAYESIWGRSCGSLYASPRSWLEAIHPEDRDRVLQAALTKQVDGHYAEEYRIVRPDGSVRWILDRAFPVKDRDGKVYRIAGVAEDITDWKEKTR